MAETLRIRVGSSLDDMVICNPNDEENPVRISNDHFEGYFLIRVHNFEGVVPDGAQKIKTTKYFEGRRRLMSFHFQGRFKQPWTANDLLWSSDWDRPLQVPKLMGMFTKFWSMTDPGSFSDLKCDTPYMRSFVATAMCTVTSWTPRAENAFDEPFRTTLVEDASALVPRDEVSRLPPRSSSSSVTASAAGSESGSNPGTPPPAPAKRIIPPRGSSIAAAKAAEQYDDNSNTKDWKLIDRICKGGDEAVKDRRKYFSSESNRHEAIFHPSRIYGFEVFNPYFDPNAFKIKIPACTIDMKKMMRGQPMRTRLMTADGKTVFFIVEVSQELTPEEEAKLNNDTEETFKPSEQLINTSMHLRSRSATKDGKVGASAGSTMSLVALPPDLIIKVFTFLPVPDLATVARASRRLKILAYNDDVYKPKLRVLGVISRSSSADQVAPTASGASGEGGSGGSGGKQLTGAAESEADAVSKLTSKLKQLPGGNMLTGGTKYLESGTLWGGLSEAQPSLLDDPIPSNNPELVVSADSSTSGENNSAGPGNSNEAMLSSLNVSANASGSASPAPVQKIVAGVPQLKKSHLVVGAGGIKAIGRSSSGLSIGSSTKKAKAPGLNGIRPRDAFKAIYTELCPYYLDFKGRQKDSKVFREVKDLVEIATLLRRIRLMSRAKFIPEMEEVNFSLETTIEWFESMILGQFERAYDTKNIVEMRRNATASYELNGGAACVQLFISKNPIFFDHTFNPSLVASKLPSGAASDPKGYALADEFAKFMDHMLVNCREQAAIVAKVFNPEMDAMTSFVSKVFEDSITEYLTAVLKTAKVREDTAIYLHTLATAVHCCTQFLDYIQTAEPGVTVHTEKIKESIAGIFRPYTEKYIPLELENLVQKCDAELAKWNKRKEKMLKGSGPGVLSPTAAGFLTDAEKAQAHKRQVMDTMKTVLYAPMALGKSLALMGGNLVGGGRQKSQNQALLDEAEEGEKATTAEEADDDAGKYQLDDNSMGSMVSLELCLNIIHANKEALGRALVITSAVDMVQLKVNAGKVFIKLLYAVGEKHIFPAFDIAIYRLSMSHPTDDWSEAGNRGVNPDSLQFFELVHIADLIHQMVDAYFAEDVRPWIDEHDFLSDVMVEKKQFDRLSDDNVAHGMDKAIQVLINQVDHILEKSQDPRDYNPPSNQTVFDLRPTKACRDVIACLNAHTRLLNSVTNKDTLEVFFGEVGVRLFNVILKNIKKHQVSQSGAMQLICDLNRYHEWATNLRVGSVARLFLVLKELGNLFLADGGQELKNLVHDSDRYQGSLRPEEIYELLASRTDYKKIQKHVESKECIIQ